MTAKPAFITERPETSAPLLTADGKPFIISMEYFFFDRQSGVVREVQGLRVVDGEFLGSLGLKIVRIDQLRGSRDNAIEDGEQYLVKEIERLRDRIRDLEAEKQPWNRTMKYLVMSRG